MLENITIEQVKLLVAQNRVVVAYPRKQLVVVDGFKRYSASPKVLKFLKDSK